MFDSDIELNYTPEFFIRSGPVYEVSFPVSIEFWSKTDCTEIVIFRLHLVTMILQAKSLITMIDNDAESLAKS